jgi:mannonate dehydratase
MLNIAEQLDPTPSPLWRLVKQAGVNHVVSLLDGGEQHWRWPTATIQDALEPPPYVAPRRGERPWERAALLHAQEQYREFGLEPVVIEDTPPMDAIRLGRPGRDEQIDWFCAQIRAMGEVGIRTLCYNWVPISDWARTSGNYRLRGGAITSSYDDSVMRSAPVLVEPGSLTHEDLWKALEYFLHAVIPVAREFGVHLALHPDDPPLPEVRGVPHIMTSVEAFERMLSIGGDSEFNGITLCQGNFRLMTDDLPALIRYFGKHIFFAHFRDVAGGPRCFVEVFHDEGPTDMLECMRAYHDIGFEGVMRPDHVPALEGETNDSFGYSTLGRLYALGYMTGLREAAYGRQRPGSSVLPSSGS